MYVRSKLFHSTISRLIITENVSSLRAVFRYDTSTLPATLRWSSTLRIDGTKDKNSSQKGKDVKTSDKTVENKRTDLVNGKTKKPGKLATPSGTPGNLIFKEKRISSEGSIEEGTFKNGLLSGIGKITDAQGRSRVGEFQNGEFVSGTGSYLEKESGDLLSGEWKNGCLHGQGMITNLFGDVLEGIFDNGVFKTGSGVLRVFNTVYEGQWQDGIMIGTKTLSYGAVLEGTFTDFKLNGPGRKTCPSFMGEIVVEGEFREDKIWNGSGMDRVNGGVVMQGNWTDGKIDGAGTIYYPNGRKKEGTFDRGNLTGRGKLTNPDGSTLVGNFVGGEISNGKGAKVTHSGNKEVGIWRGKNFHKGELHFTDGNVAKGKFIHGRLDGAGEITLADGSVRVGYFHMGITYNGEGTLKHSSSGDIVEGQWQGGKLHGHCKVTNEFGEVHEGRFENGIMIEGKGIVRNNDWGTKLEGTWSNGWLNGENNKKTYADGSVHEGFYVDGYLHGLGRILSLPDHVLEGEFRKGEIYNGKGSIRRPGRMEARGVWVDGRLTGEAVISYTNGLIREGTYVDGLLHGQGKVTQPDGSVLEGEFCMNDIFNGRGTLTHDFFGGTGVWKDGVFWEGRARKSFADGTIHEGDFVRGKLHGYCRIFNNRGGVLEGEFVNGRIFTGSGSLVERDGRVKVGVWSDGVFTKSR